MIQINLKNPKVYCDTCKWYRLTRGRYRVHYRFEYCEPVVHTGPSYRYQYSAQTEEFDPRKLNANNDCQYYKLIWWRRAIALKEELSKRKDE